MAHVWIRRQHLDDAATSLEVVDEVYESIFGEAPEGITAGAMFEQVRGVAEDINEAYVSIFGEDDKPVGSKLDRLKEAAALFKAQTKSSAIGMALLKLQLNTEVKQHAKTRQETVELKEELGITQTERDALQIELAATKAKLAVKETQDEKNDNDGKIVVPPKKEDPAKESQDMAAKMAALEAELAATRVQMEEERIQHRRTIANLEKNINALFADALAADGST